MWTVYTPCMSVAVSGDFCHETAGKCAKFDNIHVSLLSFLLWTQSRLGGLPTLTRLHGKLSPRLTGLPCLADRATRLGGSPHLSCKRDQNKIRNYMDRRVTSPTWGPPPPWKQALNCDVLQNSHNDRLYTYIYICSPRFFHYINCRRVKLLKNCSKTRWDPAQVNRNLTGLVRELCYVL